MDDSGADEEADAATAASLDVAAAAKAFAFFWDATRLATIDANGEVTDGGTTAAVVRGAG